MIQTIKNFLNYLIATFKGGFKIEETFFFLGAQRTYILPTIPISVENYHNHRFVIILRVLGGISFLY